MKNNENGSHILAIALCIVTLLVIGLGATRIISKMKDKGEQGSGISSWKNDCSGNGTVALKNSPMNPEDVTSILPYGLLAGAHVTPIDHMYFYPKSQQRDAAPVYAMADGYIVDYSVRSNSVDSGASRPSEYRIVMQHNCDFYTYFDLLTSMDAGLKAKLEKGDRHVAIKAGQEIGRVGGQSLDTAVYNLQVNLKGFINPDTYIAEPWKVHTDDFFKYFDETTRNSMLALNPRDAEPRSGKIDYDIAGKLIGNWFEEGTNGYAGPKEFQAKPGQNGKGYWSGHFSVSYDAITPEKVAFGFGEFNGKADAFMAAQPSPDPATVGVSEGLVKYELLEYKIYGGNPVDQIRQQVKIQNPQVKGVLLVQVLDGEKLKMEAFPGKNSSQVSAFTSAAKTYTR